MEMQAQVVKINGIDYAPVSEMMATRPTGNRAVVVVDRGWIYAGDVERKNGRIYLTRVVWVFKWNEIGFDGVIADPKSKKVTLRKMADVDIPEASEIFCVPVPSNWGL